MVSGNGGRGARHKRNAGLTLVELLVAVGILSFFLGFASLSQTKLVPNYRLSASARQVVTDLRLLRAKAIAQNNRFRMVFAADSNAYHAERWNASTNAWEQYALYVRDGTTDGSTQSVLLPETIVTTSAVEVTFAPRGSVTTSGTPPLTLRAPGPRSRAIAVSFAGLITIS